MVTKPPTQVGRGGGFHDPGKVAGTPVFTTKSIATATTVDDPKRLLSPGSASFRSSFSAIPACPTQLSLRARRQAQKGRRPLRHVPYTIRVWCVCRQS